MKQSDSTSQWDDCKEIVSIDVCMGVKHCITVEMKI
jgi:hypothetical protein